MSPVPAVPPGSGAAPGQAAAGLAGPSSPAVPPASAPPIEVAPPPLATPSAASRPSAGPVDGAPPAAAPPVGPLAPGGIPPLPTGGLPREASRRAQVTFERSSAAFERSRLGERPHVFDYLLDGLGGVFSARFTEGAGWLLAWVGHYGLYAAMLLVLVVHTVAAVRGKTFFPLAPAAVYVPALALLQYAAGRLANTFQRLDRPTTGQMVSTTVTDCLALFALLAGVGLLIFGSIVAVAQHAYAWILTGLAGFVVCQYAAMLALNPESLGVSILPETTVGEEAIGLVMFLAKLGIRLSPAVLAAGVLWGTVVLGYALYLALGGSAAMPQVPASLGAASSGGPNHPALDDLLGTLGGLGGGGGAGRRELQALAELSKELVLGDSVLRRSQAIGPLAVAASAEGVLLWSAAFPLLAYGGFLGAYVLAGLLRILLGLPLAHRDEARQEEKSQE